MVPPPVTTWGMGKKQAPPEDEPKDKPSRTEQARQVAEEYADDQREIIKKLRQAGAAADRDCLDYRMRPRSPITEPTKADEGLNFWSCPRNGTSDFGVRSAARLASPAYARRKRLRSQLCGRSR